MRRLIATSAVLFAVSVSPASAQGNAITVIKEDGTKVTIELEPADPILPGPAPVQPPPAPPPVPERPALREDIVPAPRPYVDEIVAPPREKEPVQEPVAAPPAAEKPLAGKPEKKTAPAQKAKKAKEKQVPKKQAKEKPPEKEAKPVPPPQGSYEFSIPPGTAITEGLAASIAMDAAPPSSGYNVLRRAYQGAEVFVIVFRTEDGPYDVLVDAATGKIVRSGYVETHSPSSPKPGHLPDDWEPYDPQPLRPKTQ